MFLVNWSGVRNRDYIPPFRLARQFRLTRMSIMARIDVIMPQMGESIAEGTLSRWIKKVGEEVKRDEPIFEISTDKVDAEIPAPGAGVLAEILVTEGQTVPVQTVVARIETEKGAATAAASARAGQGGCPGPVCLRRPASRQPAPAPPARTAPRPPLPASASGTMLWSPPATAPRRRRIGCGGSPLRWSGRSQPSTTSISLRLPVPDTPAGSPRKTSSASSSQGRRLRSVSPQQLPRRLLSPRLPPAPVWNHGKATGWNPGPAFASSPPTTWSCRGESPPTSTVSFEIDYTRVGQIRAKKKKEYAERGVNLTFLAFITKAVAENLRKHPVINSAVSNETTIFRRDINIGIAVALDWGLIVPVIKHADELSLLGIARGHQRPGRAGSEQEAESRRRAAGHLHHYQSRRVRLLCRYADHQSAAGRDPRRWRHREAAVGGDSP